MHKIAVYIIILWPSYSARGKMLSAPYTIENHEIRRPKNQIKA